tara:strand:- start:1773 stop:2015 length:243 start_codon:yes stop_codon:yes gene_type:complete
MTDIQNILKDVFSYRFMKFFVLFVICFASTKDIFVSLCVSGFIVMCMWHLLNKDSEYSLPRISKMLRKYLDLDEDTKDTV